MILRKELKQKCDILEKMLYLDLNRTRLKKKPESGQDD